MGGRGRGGSGVDGLNGPGTARATAALVALLLVIGMSAEPSRGAPAARRAAAVSPSGAGTYVVEYKGSYVAHDEAGWTTVGQTSPGASNGSQDASFDFDLKATVKLDPGKPATIASSTELTLKGLVKGRTTVGTGVSCEGKLSPRDTNLNPLTVVRPNDPRRGDVTVSTTFASDLMARSSYSGPSNLCKVFPGTSTGNTAMDEALPGTPAEIAALQRARAPSIVIAQSDLGKKLIAQPFDATITSGSSHVDLHATLSVAPARPTDHYSVELKAWIPYKEIVNPLEPVPMFLGAPNQGCLIRQPAVKNPLFFPGIESSVYLGDGHVGYEGSARVTVTASFDWDGSAMSDVQTQSKVAAAATHRLRAFRPANGTGDLIRCVERMQAKNAGSSRQTTDDTVELHINGANPFFNFLGLPLAPSIISNLEVRFAGPTTMALSWNTSRFPSHGFTISKNGKLLYRNVTQNPSCYSVLGPAGAGALLLLLGDASNTGSATLDTDEAPRTHISACAPWTPSRDVYVDLAPVPTLTPDAHDVVTIPNTVDCATACTVRATAGSLGRGTTTIAPHDAAAPTLTLTPAAAAKLDRDHRLPATITIAITHPGSAASLKTLRTTFTSPRR